MSSRKSNLGQVQLAAGQGAMVQAAGQSGSRSGLQCSHAPCDCMCGCTPALQAEAGNE